MPLSMRFQLHCKAGQGSWEAGPGEQDLQLVHVGRSPGLLLLAVCISALLHMDSQQRDQAHVQDEMRDLYAMPRMFVSD